MKIIADTPTLYSPAEGRELGISIIPACTIIGEKAYKDYEDIGTEDFLKRIEAGDVPTTSQPAIGDIIEVFEESDEEILALPIGDGLSGTYQNMEGARNMIADNSHIHIMDTKTLAGPQRYLVQKAMKLREEDCDMETIKQKLRESIETSASFVIPVDFNFLKRSGRLTPLAAKIGNIIKIVPVLTQTEDMKRITLFVIKRSKRKAIEAIMEHLKEKGVDEHYLISISHGGALEAARAVMTQMSEFFTGTEMQLHALPPSLVTHGGPGCIVIQAIRK